MRPPSTMPPTSSPEPHPPVPADSAEERELVRAVLGKDRKAAAEFVNRFADSIYAYVRYRLSPATDQVDDLVQDVFLVALERLASFAGDSSVRSWLIGIARHKVEDYYRARLRAPEALTGDEEHAATSPVTFPDLDGPIDRARMEEKTRRVLSSLPESYRIVLLWRYWERRSASEMAAHAGKTEKAIERLLARARARFKQLWNAE